MRRVIVGIPFSADGVVYEANKEYDMEESVIERALKLSPNTLTVLGCGDELAGLKAELEAQTTAKAEAEAKAEEEAKAREEAEAKAEAEAEARVKAEEELAKAKEELEKVKKELAKAKKESAKE